MIPCHPALRSPLRVVKIQLSQVVNFRLSLLYGTKRTWNDGKKRRIEERLNDIVIGLIEAAFKEKSRRAEKARSEREWQERERARKEAQEAIRKEKARLEQFETDAESWQRSQLMRAYIKAAREKASLPENEFTQKLHEWLDWATKWADRIDPLTQSPASIFDEERRK